MAKYKKKPVIVEATQWFPNHNVEGVTNGKVTTIHGDVIDLAPGDWVITEPDGIHHYPCKNDIFQKFYELCVSQEVH